MLLLFTSPAVPFFLFLSLLVHQIKEPQLPIDQISPSIFSKPSRAFHSILTIPHSFSRSLLLFLFLCFCFPLSCCSLVRLKNRNSQLIKSLLQFPPCHRVLLTGTPVQNNVKELWTLLFFIDRNTFSSCARFEAKYGNMKNAETVDELHKEMEPYFLRFAKFFFCFDCHFVSLLLSSVLWLFFFPFVAFRFHECPCHQSFLSSLFFCLPSLCLSCAFPGLNVCLCSRHKSDVEQSLPAKEETIIEVELTHIQKQYYKAIFERNTTFLLRQSRSRMSMPSLMNIAMQLRKCCNHPFTLEGVEEMMTQSHASPAEQIKNIVQAAGKMVLLDKVRCCMMMMMMTMMMMIYHCIHFGVYYCFYPVRDLPYHPTHFCFFSRFVLFFSSLVVDCDSLFPC